MKVNGTLINYYFHCKRQCYLHGNRLNLEDNSEEVKIGKALHEERDKSENTEIILDNIRLDKLTSQYLTEVKKSDADIDAAMWQLLFYLRMLKGKGIIRKGKLECVEKSHAGNKILYFDLTEDNEKALEFYTIQIEELLDGEEIPKAINQPRCKKCAYYEYCYI